MIAQSLHLCSDFENYNSNTIFITIRLGFGRILEKQDIKNILRMESLTLLPFPMDFILTYSSYRAC